MCICSLSERIVRVLYLLVSASNSGHKEASQNKVNEFTDPPHPKRDLLVTQKWQPKLTFQTQAYIRCVSPLLWDSVLRWIPARYLSFMCVIRFIMIPVGRPSQRKNVKETESDLNTPFGVNTESMCVIDFIWQSLRRLKWRLRNVNGGTHLLLKTICSISFLAQLKSILLII